MPPPSRETRSPFWIPRSTKESMLGPEGEIFALEITSPCGPSGGRIGPSRNGLIIRFSALIGVAGLLLTEERTALLPCSLSTLPNGD